MTFACRLTLKSLLLSLTLLMFPCHLVAQNKPTPEAVALAAQGVADWQIAHFRDTFSGYPAPHDIRDWTNAAFYVGFMKWVDITGDKRYLEWAKSVAERANWQLFDRTYMADDHAVGQLYFELYRHYGDKAMLAPTQKALDYILAHPSEEGISIGDYVFFERWSWCDALFMSPPVWARMAKLTGDQRYNEFMMKELKATVDHLYDPSEGLFFRDANFIDKRVNDKKVFWSRGNGWVFAGLTLVMDELDKNSADYQYLLNLYLQMANSLVKIQTAQGHWAMSLLNDEGYPAPETSGTSFFTYGLAWGVNKGLLKDEKYTQAIFKGWNALTAAIQKDGMLGYVQAIGKNPGQATADKTETYGSGAFLAASSEVFRLVGGVPPAAIADSKQLKSAIKSTDAKLNKELKAFNNPKRVRTFARFVPERSDDFAWENDLVAFRAYGPALREGPENSGVDCWLKRVKYPIINKWYYQDIHKGISYHEDHGEGLDNYKVGASAGCGGTALWLNGKREPLETFTRASVQNSKADAVVFTLTYHRNINGDDYREDKRVMLKLGSRLFSVESTFWKNGKIAVNLPVAIGVTTHDGNALATFNQKAGWLATWEDLDGFGLGTAVLMDPKTIVDTASVYKEGVVDSGHALYIAHTNAQGKVSYFAGYGWEKAKEIRSANDWHNYLTEFSVNVAAQTVMPKH